MCSVSSVLNRDIKQHGKTFLFDGCEDTAWSSDQVEYAWHHIAIAPPPLTRFHSRSQGTPQHIALLLNPAVTVSALSIQFQGGFAGKDCTMTLESEDGRPLHSEPFYPDDINAKQLFRLQSPVELVTKVRVLFKGSTDFFGRIIVYGFELFWWLNELSVIYLCTQIGCINQSNIIYGEAVLDTMLAAKIY